LGKPWPCAALEALHVSDIYHALCMCWVYCMPADGQGHDLFAMRAAMRAIEVLSVEGL
jgi:hypothetical protein